MDRSMVKLRTFIHDRMCIFVAIHLCPTLMKSTDPITVIGPQRAFTVNDDNLQEIIKT